MNPIIRMMKRYIKMPPKYVLPLLFIGALVLTCTAGCTSSTNPTATPTATTTTSTALKLTQLLQKMEPALKQYNVTEGPGGLLLSWTTPKGWDVTAAIEDYKNVTTATNHFNVMKTPTSSSETNAPNSVTGFGKQAATAALGHTPNVANDAYLKGVGSWTGSDTEYLQYDQIIISINYSAPS